jgi:hypothetical protein
MWREDTVGEAHIGKIAARGFAPGINRNRAAAERESVTPGRIVYWCC